MSNAFAEQTTRRPPSVQRFQRGEDLLEPAQNPGALLLAPNRGSLQALQRAAGNQAVSRLLGAKVPAPNVQRCGPGGCTDGGKDQTEETPVAAQGIEGLVDEPLVAAQGVVQRKVTDGDRAPTVQRAAPFTVGPVHEVNNLAQCLVDGNPVGVTNAVLNGRVLRTGADVHSALVAPTVTTTAVASGGFEAQVDTVPTNAGSFDETVLAAGPWRHNTTKAVFAAMHPSVTGCAGAGATRFRAFGAPTDAAMSSANRRHEDRHARDFKNVFDTTIVPWDHKIVAAKAAGTKFQGATAAAAEAALWAAMGGTPAQIATAFITAIVAAIAAYHGTPAGGPVAPTGRAGARSHCSICWAYYRNPS